MGIKIKQQNFIPVKSEIKFKIFEALNIEPINNFHNGMH
jgi:hypothetical protein